VTTDVARAREVYETTLGPKSGTGANMSSGRRGVLAKRLPKLATFLRDIVDEIGDQEPENIK
jgi:hypothetical protein